MVKLFLLNWREFPYFPDQPLYSAFLLLTCLTSQTQQSRRGDPKLSPYLLYIQVGIGAGGDTNVTVTQQLTGGLPMVSTSATTHHAPTGDGSPKVVNGDAFALTFPLSPTLSVIRS
ncbi:hypothetical protein [Shewanella algae]|uniref:hypothetical protein n=1 Tax=Shewanella algae TaxID=38313 RepID=UPI0031F4D70D